MTSKGPPPPIKPKPKGLAPPIVGKKPNIDVSTTSNISHGNKAGDNGFAASSKGNIIEGNIAPAIPANKTVDKSVLDSIVSKPITMSVDVNSEEDDSEDEYETPNPEAPLHKTTLGSSRGNDVKKFPPPPQRNKFAVATAMASPLKKSSINQLDDESNSEQLSSSLFASKTQRLDSRDTIDYAEGMRSPLKKNGLSSSSLSSFPPPPRRNNTTLNKDKSPTPDNDDNLPPPKLPARNRTTSTSRTTMRSVDSVDDMAPPKLPNRNRVNSRAKHELDRSLDYKENEDGGKFMYSPLKSRNHNSKGEFNDYSDEQHDVDLPPRNRNSPIKRNSTNNSRYYSERDNGYSSSDDDYGYGKDIDNKPSLRRDSSQLLNSAKIFSKNSFNSAKEKSTPYAKHALGEFNKMKGKLKNKIGKDDNYDYSDSEDDSRYTRRVEGSQIPARDTAHGKPIRPTRSTTPEESPDPAEIYDTSIDEDRPPLPVRKAGARFQNSGIPLPGLTGESLHSKPSLKAKPKPKPPVPTKSKAVLSPDNNDLERTNSTLTPPAAPPVRRLYSNSVSSATSSIPPPAPPSRNRPPVVPPSRSTAPVWEKPVLDLELESLWFMDDNLSRLPKCLQGLNCQWSHGFVGTKQFKIYAFRLQDLATMKLKLVWKKDCENPLDFLTDEIDFIPPPTATKTLLVEGHEKYGEHVANWCEVKEGQTVGNGECWTLVHDALEKACGKYAFVSSGLNHGALIATFKGAGSGIPSVIIPPVSDDIRRGDILQFKSCTFKYPQRIITFGEPDHTAVILDIKEGDAAGEDKRMKWFEIVQQNVNGVKKVRVSDIDLSKLVSGELRIFRPVDADWIPDLADVVV